MTDEMEKFEDEPSFSLDDFKKWMSSQNDKPTPRARRYQELLGQQVESKISPKKLLHKIDPQEGDIHELAEDFYQYGGIILDVDDENNLTIEVDSGSFILPKFFVKKAK